MEPRTSVRAALQLPWRGWAPTDVGGYGGEFAAVTPDDGWFLNA
jgi:hypothetical protein